jgi:putative Mn2+ efflux pump MntP
LNLIFFFNSAMLGVGLAMDAFCVSMTNGMTEPRMSRRKAVLIAGTFAWFQFMMPMIGWGCVRTVVRYFQAFQTAIPYIALILLLYIGGKLLFEGLKKNCNENGCAHLKKRELFLQGIATSIDALSVGFMIAGYRVFKAFSAGVIIAIVTFLLCVVGIRIGRRFGMRLADRANILGGVILIAIGLEIFVTGVF